MPRSVIFVTGAPRSGTTFLGRALSLAPTVGYIHEPFNPQCGVPSVTQRYMYAGEPAFSGQVRGILASIPPLDLVLRTAIYPRDSLPRRIVKRLLGSRGPFYLRIARRKPDLSHLVVKDPVGCLTTKMAVEEFSFLPVILIRHPAAVVASFLRLGWTGARDLEALASQPTFLRDFGIAAETVAVESDAISDISRFWLAINMGIVGIADALGIPVIRHEDLSQDPVRVIRHLYEVLHLPWSDRILQAVTSMTSQRNPGEARRGRVQDFSRDSRSLNRVRVAALDSHARHRIYDLARPLAERFYPNDIPSGDTEDE